MKVCQIYVSAEIAHHFIDLKTDISYPSNVLALKIQLSYGSEQNHRCNRQVNKITDVITDVIYTNEGTNTLTIM